LFAGDEVRINTNIIDTLTRIFIKQTMSVNTDEGFKIASEHKVGYSVKDLQTGSFSIPPWLTQQLRTEI
jgi:hypothetical protein